MAQLMPLPPTVSCFSKILIGFTFLVPAHLGSPGQRAVKRVCVCVCAWAPMPFKGLTDQMYAAAGGGGGNVRRRHHRSHHHRHQHACHHPSGSEVVAAAAGAGRCCRYPAGRCPRS